MISWLPPFSVNRISFYLSNQGGSQEHGTTFRALKVTSQLATAGAESAVYDCLVLIRNKCNETPTQWVSVSMRRCEAPCSISNETSRLYARLRQCRLYLHRGPGHPQPNWRRQRGPWGPAPPMAGQKRIFCQNRGTFKFQLNPVVHVTIIQREGGISIRCPPCIRV